jgi:hypothetical protein
MFTNTGEIDKSSADALVASGLVAAWALCSFSSRFSSSSKRFFLSAAFAAASDDVGALDEFGCVRGLGLGLSRQARSKSQSCDCD